MDRIRQILAEMGGRAQAGDLLDRLREVEGDADVSQTAIYIAIRRENDRLLSLGEAAAFRTRREGEQHGFVALETQPDIEASSPAREFERQIRAANARVDDELRARLEKMDWRTFESTFLTVVLEELGFKDVKITQATRDGGVDARANYVRGIVDARAIISAKHWQSRSAVPATEVRNLRGIKGDEDTAIIITSGRISPDAKAEAAPSQNQRVVYLIDGDQLVALCKRHSVGVTRVQLPELLTIDESVFEGEPEVTPDVALRAPAIDEPRDPDGGRRRLRVEMLGDEDRGLSVTEIAGLLGLTEGSVRTYLSDSGRKQDVFQRLRDPTVRERALAIVQRKRA